ncbi:unnamed protein product [Linum trigynum]|uniref:Uncharacterized protein n=1 Tax=Linum trigynum TaxID=586398 RepID=A0AAV2DDV6_9ROSI
MLATKPKRKTHQRKVKKVGVEDNTKVTSGANTESGSRLVVLASYEAMDDGMDVENVEEFHVEMVTEAIGENIE